MQLVAQETRSAEPDVTGVVRGPGLPYQRAGACSPSMPWTGVARWRLTDQGVLAALLAPEEVLRGHRGRFIAHRRARGRVLRVIYEYEGPTPVVITVYNPLAQRYFHGGAVYEDRILP